MTTQYVMKAFNTVTSTTVYWAVLGTPDFTGAESGYNPADLTSIAIDYSFSVPINGEGGINPVGLVGGDLSGTLPNPSVVQIYGNPVSNNSVANDGYALVSQGETWTPTGVTTIFNVKNFGAKGNGTTDDSAAIQAALNIASGQSNTTPITIYFPLGTYIVKERLVFTGNGGNFLRFIGEGIGRQFGTWIKWDGISGTTMLDGYGLNFSTFEHIGFDGSGLANCCVWLHTDQPFGGAGSDNIQFDRCVFQGAVGSNSALVNLGDPTNTQQLSTVWFSGCLFNGDGYGANQTYACIQAMQSGVGNTETFLFYNCEISSAQYGFIFNNSNNDMLFDACQFGNIGSVCIQYGFGQCTIRHCQVEATTSTGVGGTDAYFVNAGSESHTHITACELVMNLYNSTVNSAPNCLVSTSGSLTIEDCLVDGTGGGNDGHGNLTIASVQVSGPIINGATFLTSSLCLKNNLWINVNPAGQTNIPVYQGANLVTGHYGQEHPTSIELIGNSGALPYTTTAYGLLPDLRGNDAEIQNIALDSSIQDASIFAVYRGRTRHTTHCYEIDFTAAGFTANTASVTLLLGQIQTKSRVINVISDTTIAFAGTGISGVTLEVGTNTGSGFGNGYILSHDVHTTAVVKGLVSGDLGSSLSTTVQGGDQYANAYWGGGTSIQVTLTSSGANFGNGSVTNLTAGKTRVFVTIELYGNP